jgi:hypothetical protein
MWFFKTFYSDTKPHDIKKQVTIFLNKMIIKLVTQQSYFEKKTQQVDG